MYKISGNRCIALLLAVIIMMSLIGCGSTESITTEDASAHDTKEEAITSPIISEVPSENQEVVAETPTQDSDSLSEVDTEKADNNTPSESSNTPESITTPAPTATPIPTDTPISTINVEPQAENTSKMTETQRNSINMLNYMSALTQKVNEDRKNQLLLDSAYHSFDNLNPNAVDKTTQAQIGYLMDTINEYRMISVKQARLDYINEQNRAQAMRNAIPNPVGLLSAVQSGSLIKAAVSVIYMTVDSISGYRSAISQADKHFLEGGWELDDAESAALHKQTKDRLTYLFDMVRSYDLPGEYALSEEAIRDYVEWARKPEAQLTGKIVWLESHKNDYREFGPYWLELAKDYYKAEKYRECLDAIKQYESLEIHIFRKNADYANALPMIIFSAKRTQNKEQYVKTAEKYCAEIMSNSKDSDWSLRYFAAQIYMDLYAITNKDLYLDKAYDIVLNNVVNLVDSQKALNEAYIAPVKLETAKKDASKREKEEIEKYNDLIKEERKTALPPVNEALYLNCDLLFALSEVKDISPAQMRSIDSILHEEGRNIFLTDSLDARFWASRKNIPIREEDIDISFDGGTITLPATCISDRSAIIATITGPYRTEVIDDWIVKDVKRPKNANCSDYIVSLISKTGESYKYQSGETITIKVIPVADTPDYCIEFKYNVVVSTIVVFKGIEFERVK